MDTDEQARLNSEREDAINEVLQAEREYYEEIDARNYVMPEFIEVEIKLADGSMKIQTVQIEKCQVGMTWLGGMRNKITGIQYYHACINTDQYLTNHKDKLTREVQTWQWRTRSTTMKRECGTQMEKVGVVYMDPRSDVEVQAQEYFTSEMWEDLRLRSVMTM